MRRVAPIVLLLLAACGDIFAPNRTGVYQYRDFQSKGAGGGVDTITFHWSRAMLPVRIYVADNDPLRPYAQLAIARWSGAFLYGEFSGVLVNDSTKADVIILNTIPNDGNFVRERLAATAPGCTGATDRPVGQVVHVPIHSNIWSNTGSQVPGLDACYSITVTHELGHALGILNHSPNVGDVMYPSPLLDGISDRDRQTIETAYHTPATATVVGRP